MNLNDFRTRTARVVGMSPTTTADTNLIDAWANESVVQFLRAVKMYVLPAALAVTAGQDDYELDTDILSLEDLWYEPADQTQDLLLEPTSSREISRMRLYQTAADVTPRYYSLEGSNLLRLYPAPLSSSDIIHILYVPRPSLAMSATAHSPASSAYGGIPEEYHPTLEAYVKWKAAEAEEHKPSQNGLQFQAEWETGLSRCRADMNKKTGAFQGKKRAGRRYIYPVTPGTDIRYG